MAYTPGINWIDIPGSWYCSLRPRRRPAANAQSGAALGTAAAQVAEICRARRRNSGAIEVH